MDMEAYGGLRLTEAARPVLRGEQAVWLRRDAEPARRKGSKAERGSRLREAFAGANDDPLWQALKAKRMELAREQGVPFPSSEVKLSNFPLDALTKVPISPEEEGMLLKLLKTQRSELARQESVPPYVIFHDKTLAEICTRLPTSLEEFGNIFGVGQAKQTRYGPIFIEIVSFFLMEGRCYE